MAKECLWYNGESGCYELMDFDPDGLSKEELNLKIKEWFFCKSLLDAEEIKKARETVYLLDVKHLEKVD